MTNTNNKTATKILETVAIFSGVTSVGLVAQHTGYSMATVRKYVDAFIAEGRIGIGWDGAALELSDKEVAERALYAATH